jgi:hypothetical protein
MGLCQTGDLDIVLDFEKTADLYDLVDMGHQRLYLKDIEVAIPRGSTASAGSVRNSFPFGKGGCRGI